jgi:tetratricopeptide (TPR) repeat protein
MHYNYRHLRFLLVLGLFCVVVSGSRSTSAQDFFEEIWVSGIDGPGTNAPLLADLFATGKPVVIFSNDDGEVWAVNPADGTEYWSVSLEGKKLTAPVSGAFTADGALDIVVASQDDDKRIYLLEGSSGEVLTRYPLPAPAGAAPSPFELEATDADPQRHGLAVVDSKGTPYLLAASDEGSNFKPYRELSKETLEMMEAGGAPIGPPAVGQIFSNTSVDIAFAYKKMIVVLEREGANQATYKLPAEHGPGTISTMPISANTFQNARTDSLDWDQLMFGVYDNETKSTQYYQLEYNENVKSTNLHYPFLSNWFRARARTEVQGQGYYPVTVNWDIDKKRTELVLAGERDLKGFPGTINTRSFIDSAEGGVAVPPVGLEGENRTSHIFVFDAAAPKVYVRQAKKIDGGADPYNIPFAPVVQPVVGDLLGTGDSYQIIIIGEDQVGCYKLPLVNVEKPATIAVQTDGGNVYRTGGYSKRLANQEKIRRSLLNTRITDLIAMSQQAKDQSAWDEARKHVEAAIRINPFNEDAIALRRSVFIRQNLALLISGSLLVLVILAAAIYLVTRLFTKSSGLKKADGFIQAGHPDQALEIYHRLHEKFPKDEQVSKLLVETIIKNGVHTEQSIPPLTEAHQRDGNNEDVLKALVLCHLNNNNLSPDMLKLYQRAEDHLEDNALLKYSIARILRESEQLEPAEDKYREAIKLDNPPKEAFVELADLLLNQEMANARNLTIFENAYQSQPDDVGFLRGLCLSMIDAKRIDAEAQVIFEKMLDHDKTYVPALLQLCQAKIQGGQIEEAVVHAHKIQQLDPENKEGIYLLSQCYLIQGRGDDTAIRTLKSAAEHFPDDREIYSALARNYILQKRADEEAIACYRQAWRLNPNDLDITKTMAKVAWAQKDMQLTISTNEKLMEAGTISPNNLKQLAEAYIATDMREEKGERVLRDILKAEPNNTKYLAHLSRIYIQSERLDGEALKVYQAAYAAVPSFDIGRMYVRALFQNEQFQEVGKIAPKLLEAKPDDDELKKISAQASIASNQIDDAIEQFERVLEHNPEDDDALVNLAMAYAQKGSTDERPISLYKRALEINQNVDVIWMVMAHVAMKQNNQEEAVANFKKALGAAPQNAERVASEIQLILSKHPDALRLRWLLAEVLVYSNRLREASDELNAIFESDPSQATLVINGFSKILDKDPQSQSALVSRGLLKKTQGNYDEARVDVEKAFELNPANPDAQRELIELYQAMLNENDDIELRHKLGVVLMKSEEFDKAIACFQRTSQDYRFESEATKLLGQCFVQKNMLDLALQQFKKLVVDDELKDILYDLAQRYEHKKDIIGAKTVYKTLFAADISYRDVKTKFEAMAGSTSDPMVFEKTVMQTQLSPEAQQRYELIDELGRGAMGIVYKARDNELDEVVALKILPESISNNPEAVRRFRIEARSARRLAHPNIIRIHDIGEEMGRKFISMEFVEGDDLKAKFRSEGKPPLEDLAKWSREIGSALAYAHSMGIVHRDIKPANIMVTGDGIMKVADFGIAKNMAAADATMTGAVMGTPLYMSPEQVRGEQIDHRADIYSFGVMLYELSSGRPPFVEGDLAYQHINVDPKPIEDVPPEWNDIVQKCLAKDREDRWENLEVFSDAVRDFQRSM